MLFNKSHMRGVSFVALSLMAGAVQAHPGHSEAGFAAGLVHPFMGLDHLLAMVAVGTWTCIALPKETRIAGPLVFLSMLAVGALLASVVRADMVGVEIGVALSVALLGALILFGNKLPNTAGLLMVGAAALLHGLAHGSELVMDVPRMEMIGGMLLGSALLHGAGYVMGAQLLNAPRWMRRAIAAGLGVSGLALLATRL